MFKQLALFIILSGLLFYRQEADGEDSQPKAKSAQEIKCEKHKLNNPGKKWVCVWSPSQNKCLEGYTFSHKVDHCNDTCLTPGEACRICKDELIDTYGHLGRLDCEESN